MANLYTVLRTIYRECDTSRLLNDSDFFLQQIGARYEPAFKNDCKLIERAVHGDVGPALYQYLIAQSIPSVGETSMILRGLQSRTGFSLPEAERALGFLYYMLGWNEDGTTNITAQAPPAPQNYPQHPSTVQTAPAPRPVSYAPPAAQNPTRTASPAPGNAASRPSGPARKPSAGKGSGQGNGIRAFLASRTGRTILTVILYIIFGILLLVLIPMVGSIKDEGLQLLTFFLLCVFMGFFGWHSLTRIQPKVFMFLPIVGWVNYFLIKGILSSIVGWFVAPYQLAKMITSKL